MFTNILGFLMTQKIHLKLKNPEFSCRFLSEIFDTPCDVVPSTRGPSFCFSFADCKLYFHASDAKVITSHVILEWDSLILSGLKEQSSREVRKENLKNLYQKMSFLLYTKSSQTSGQVPQGFRIIQEDDSALVLYLGQGLVFRFC